MAAPYTNESTSNKDMSMKSSRRPLSTLLLGAALLLPMSAFAVRESESDTTLRLSSRLDSTVEREHAAGRFDGVVLVGRGNDIVYQRAIGFANRADHVLHRVDEPWRLASVSKQVAALLLMQQVERGRVTLDSRLSDVLPDFHTPLAEQLTLRHLLQHTSGLPNPDDTLAAGSPPEAMPAFYTRAFSDEHGPLKAALDYCAGPPTGLPGAKFMYDNCDTLIVQAVLERLTGDGYSRLVQQAIAAPLVLKHWAMALPGAPALDMPIGYLDARRTEPAFNLATFGASGALVGSAGDLWEFDRALMLHRLLGERATREMWTGDPRLGYVALGAWSFSAPLSGCAKPVALVERRGEIGGVQVRNLIAPELGAAVIIASNTAETEFGELWQGKGWMHEVASIAFCTADRPSGAASH